MLKNSLIRYHSVNEYKNYLYTGFGYGIGYKLENLVYLNLKRAGFKVYTGVFRDKEVDFVALKDDKTLYVQTTYLMIDESTIVREYSPLESISDNYEKVVVSLDDIQFPKKMELNTNKFGDLIRENARSLIALVSGHLLYDFFHCHCRGIGVY